MNGGGPSAAAPVIKKTGIEPADSTAK